MSEIFDLTKEFTEDTRKDKINATIGVVVDDNGKPYVMPCVKQAIKDLKFDNFNYLPIAGDKDYLWQVKNLLSLHDYKIQGTCGGTNALFLWWWLKDSEGVIIREPTWENHRNIFYGARIKWSDFRDLKKKLKKYPDTPVLYQIVDNPTGEYWTHKQWDELAEFKNPVLFDIPYLGLGKGFVEDLYPLRLFPNADIAISFSKIMTLYQHRVGALLTKKDWDMEGMFRKINSNPPAFGELVVANVLDSYYLNWRDQLDKMRLMIDKRRKVFGVEGHGLYSLLPTQKIRTLKEKYGVYLMSNGRINFGGITLKQAERINEKINVG